MLRLCKFLITTLLSVGAILSYAGSGLTITVNSDNDVKVAPGKSTEFTVTLTNTSDETLQIKSLCLRPDDNLKGHITSFEPDVSDFSLVGNDSQELTITMAVDDDTLEGKHAENSLEVTMGTNGAIDQTKPFTIDVNANYATSTYLYIADSSAQLRAQGSGSVTRCKINSDKTVSDCSQQATSSFEISNPQSLAVSSDNSHLFIYDAAPPPTEKYF